MRQTSAMGHLADGLCKTRILAAAAGDFRSLAPQDQRNGSIETKSNARTAAIIGLFRVFRSCSVAPECLAGDTVKAPPSATGVPDRRAPALPSTEVPLSAATRWLSNLPFDNRMRLPFARQNKVQEDGRQCPDDHPVCRDNLDRRWKGFEYRCWGKVRDHGETG